MPLLLLLAIAPCQAQRNDDVAVYAPKADADLGGKFTLFQAKKILQAYPGTNERYDWWNLMPWVRGVNVDAQGLVLNVPGWDNAKPCPFARLDFSIFEFHAPNFDRFYYLYACRENIWFKTKASAHQFADVLLYMREVNTGRITPQAPVEEASFAEVAQKYREAQPKPVFPEEGRCYRVQAEFMAQQKRYEDAINLYEQGIKVAPWWPEGHFNTALLLGEMKRWEEAIAAMKRYVMLTPDAPDARAAQDKLYQWEAAMQMELPAAAAPRRSGGGGLSGRISGGK